MLEVGEPGQHPTWV